MAQHGVPSALVEKGNSMKDLENEKITITGAFPLVHNRSVVDYLLAKVNDAEKERAERGESFAMAPMSYAGFVVGVAKMLYGNEPQRGQILDEIVGALNELYDKTDVTAPGVIGDINPEEEEALVEYLLWLKGGYTDLDGEHVDAEKPDENTLYVASTAIYKMVADCS